MISSGKADFDYNGYVSNANGTFYVEAGKVNTNANGVMSRMMHLYMLKTDR